MRNDRPPFPPPKGGSEGIALRSGGRAPISSKCGLRLKAGLASVLSGAPFRWVSDVTHRSRHCPEGEERPRGLMSPIIGRLSQRISSFSTHSFRASRCNGLSDRTKIGYRRERRRRGRRTNCRLPSAVLLPRGRHQPGRRAVGGESRYSLPVTLAAFLSWASWP
jgi:hypothetical protein